MSAEKEANCKDRIRGEYQSTVETLRVLWKDYCDGGEGVEDIGTLSEYGLSFDYVEPNTFNDQPYGYWRYLLSWGGPSDEFRLYGGGLIVYHFMDWFDGAELDVTDDDLELMSDIFEDFLSFQEDRYGF